MRGQWAFNQSYYSKVDCEELVAKALEIEPTDPRIGFDNSQVNNEYRRSKLRWLYEDDARFRPVFDEFWKFAIQVNREWFGFNLTHLPPLQFTEYKADYLGEYKSHQDVFWLNPTPRHRKLSLVLQLSDPADYDGGDFVLESIDEYPPAEAIRQQGTFISFPSFVYHKATPVTRGTRYSLIGWFEGPKFQ
jgi:PKHD-type hydroxylase